MADSPPFSLDPLEPTFVGPKPIEEAPDSEFYELESRGRLIIEPKRNGHCVYVPVAGRRQKVNIYSRRVKHWTEKFPSVVEELRSNNIPADSLTVGEMTLTIKGVDSPSEFSRLSLSNPERAIALQRDCAPVELTLFNVLVRGGESVAHEPYENRLDMLRNMVRQSGIHVKVVDELKMKFDAARKHSLKNKWEGLVLYDRNAPTAFRVGANIPLRPYGCWKWKKYHSDDFVVMGWIRSTSKKYCGLVKDILLGQHNPQTGVLESWGQVGNGLTDEQKLDLTKKMPPVVVVQFERRTSKKRLIGAHILGFRDADDKAPEECIAPF